MKIAKPKLLRLTERRQYRQMGEFECACGGVFEATVYEVRSGRRKTCGCPLRFEGSRQKNTVHGMSRSATYSTWRAVLKRCTNPKHPAYEKYKNMLPSRWNSFENFYADMGERPDGDYYTLDRIDNTKGYSKENCRWADMTTQQRNRSNTLYIEYQDNKMRLTEYAEQNSLTYSTAYMRLVRGQLNGVRRCKN